MKKTIVALMLLTSLGAGLPALAAEPSLHDVYRVAEAGRLDDAQHMMQEVLQAHPNSGKAHYVEADLLAKQGKLKQATDELATAEKLAPGLPFANAQAVSNLKNSLNRSTHSAAAMAPLQSPSLAQPAGESGFPWGTLAMVAGLIAFIAWVTKFMSNRNPPAGAVPAEPGMGYRPVYPPSPYGGAAPAYGGPAPYAGNGPGLGSQVLGGLATGAAVGAGVVAGEALMHHFMDGHPKTPASDQNFASFDSIPSLPSSSSDDLGGNDFGIADNSSWDDSSGGDSDWN